MSPRTTHLAGAVAEGAGRGRCYAELLEFRAGRAARHFLLCVYGGASVPWSLERAIRLYAAEEALLAWTEATGGRGLPAGVFGGMAGDGR